MPREKLDFAGGVLSGFPWPYARVCGLIARRRMYRKGDHREFRAQRSSSRVLEGLTIFYSRRPRKALHLADAKPRAAQNRVSRLLFRHSERRMPI